MVTVNDPAAVDATHQRIAGLVQDMYGCLLYTSDAADEL